MDGPVMFAVTEFDCMFKFPSSNQKHYFIGKKPLISSFNIKLIFFVEYVLLKRTFEVLNLLSISSTFFARDFWTKFWCQKLRSWLLGLKFWPQKICMKNTHVKG
jgi:hypothetical protein